MDNRNDNFKINFIGIGAGRSASTWIFRCLCAHPRICGAKRKETKFFLYKDKKIKEYKRYFSHCDPILLKGEFTPSYLYSETAAKRIKKNFPDAKLLVCLRNPIERLISHYHFRAARGELNEKEIEKEINKDLINYPADKNGILEKGFYYKYLLMYFKIFPRNQILVMIFEDIEKDPVNFIQRIYKFLGVDPKFVPREINEKINFISKNRRRFPIFNKITFMFKSRLYNAGKSGKILIKILKLLGIKKIYHYLSILNLRKNGLKSKNKILISSQTKSRLIKFYKNDIRNLEVLLNKDLEFWLK